MKKEKLFYEKLKDVFIGAKIEGESGYVNLMRIKSAYFDVIFKQLNKFINEKLKEFPEFREELFDKLYDFFKTYFSESGSIYFTYTPLKKKIYEKIYTNDKDVVLFWKTHMLYYVKTDRLWKNLELEYEKDGLKYKIKFDVSKLEHQKANEKRDIYYELAEVKNNEIIFNVFYSERGKKTKGDKILKELKKNGVKFDEEDLEKVFRIFEKQNEVDFFINKDAESFLKEQFDLWLKNYLFDDESDFSERRLKELKTLKEVAYKIIEFVAQFEDELVKIWNKPKFVLNSNYVITLDRIAKKENGMKIIELILKDDGINEQIAEWKELGFIDENFKLKDLFKTTLNGKALNEKYQFLPVDTKYFSEDIKYAILSLFDNLDEELDGWLIKSENYQALNTILPKFKEKVQTIYIDPPFNLDYSTDFFYKSNFKNSSWLTMLENRISLSKFMLNESASFFIKLDYNGNYLVRPLLNLIFGYKNFRNEIVLSRVSKQDIKVRKLNNATDYILYYCKDTNKVKFKLIFKQLKKPKSERWHSLDAQGQGKPLRIFDYVFPPPPGRHWMLNEKKIKERIKKREIRLVCRKCGYIHSQGSWKGCPKCGNKDDVRIEYKLKPTDKKPVDTNWTDVPGYTSVWDFSTENSESSVKRIITMSSDPNDLILDFFLGSGTTTAVAHKLKRKWIGMEMGEHFYTVVLPRMKKVLFYDKSGISKEKDVKKHYDEKNAGGFFKYYELEQYEDTLRKCVYKESHPFVDFDSKDIYNQYVFLKDPKMLHAVELDYKNNKVKIYFSKLYDNIDIAETLSNLTEKWIKRITKNYVELEDGEKIRFDNIPFRLIKPLIWW